MKPDGKFVSVATIGSEGERLLVESILVHARIDFVLKNDGVQNLFGAGQIGGTNLVTGPVEVLVSGSDRARAIAILDAGSGSPTEDHDELTVDTCPACGASASELSECPECGLVLSRSGLQAHSKQEPETPPVEESAEESYRRYTRYSLVWAVLWLAGIGSLLAIYFGTKALAVRAEFSSVAAPSPIKPLLGIFLGAVGFAFWAINWYIGL